MYVGNYWANRRNKKLSRSRTDQFRDKAKNSFLNRGLLERELNLTIWVHKHFLKKKYVLETYNKKQKLKSKLSSENN